MPPRGDPLSQCRDLKGLEHEICRTALHHLLFDEGIVVCACDDELGTLAAGRLNLLHEFYCVHVGQDGVHHNHVGGIAFDRLQQGGSVLGSGHDVHALSPKGTGAGNAVFDTVVTNQNLYLINHCSTSYFFLLTYINTHADKVQEFILPKNVVF